MGIQHLAARTGRRVHATMHAWQFEHYLLGFYLSCTVNTLKSDIRFLAWLFIAEAVFSWFILIVRKILSHSEQLEICCLSSSRKRSPYLLLAFTHEKQQGIDKRAQSIRIEDFLITLSRRKLLDSNMTLEIFPVSRLSINSETDAHLLPLLDWWNRDRENARDRSRSLLRTMWSHTVSSFTPHGHFHYTLCI